MIKITPVVQKKVLLLKNGEIAKLSYGTNENGQHFVRCVSGRGEQLTGKGAFGSMEHVLKQAELILKNLKEQVLPGSNPFQ